MVLKGLKRALSSGASSSGAGTSKKQKAPKKPTLSKDAKAMPKQTHPWLLWPGTHNNKTYQVKLQNELAKIYRKRLAVPRHLDWELIQSLNVEEEFRAMLRTSIELDDGSTWSIPMWERAFEVNEDVYREWVLEFHATFHLEQGFNKENIMTEEVVSFRLGGQERSMTLVEFGRRLGLFTEEETRHPYFRKFMMEGDTTTALTNKNSVWYKISGQRKFKNNVSTYEQVRLPLLRLVGRYLAHSFNHRGTHFEKVVDEDLFLLRYFHRSDPFSFVNVPYVLAEHLYLKGTGSKAKSQLVGGHFVTRLVRSFGLLTEANAHLCSECVESLPVDKDLCRAFLTRDRTSLKPDGPTPVPRVVPPTPRVDNSMIYDVCMDMREKLNIQGGQLGRMSYQMERYQPMWEPQYQAFVESQPGMQFSPYVPPPFYQPQVPSTSHFTGGAPGTDDDDDDDDDEDDEEESGDEEDEDEGEESDE